MYYMNNNDLPQSYVDAGGLIFGLFCFYIISFAAAWCWGYSKRD